MTFLRGAVARIFLFLRGAVARNFAMAAPPSDVIRLAEMVARTLDAGDRKEFESVINLVRRGRMSTKQMMNILDELQSSGSQPAPHKAPPAHLRPSPQPQAAAASSQCPQQPFQCPQQPCFQGGLAAGPPVSLWTGAWGSQPCGVLNLGEALFDGTQWIPAQGQGGKGGRGGRHQGQGGKGGRGGRHHQGKGWKGGKGKDGKKGFPRAPNYATARQNMEQFMAENPDFVFYPRGDVPDDVKKIWEMLHEDRDNLCRALYKHFADNPAAFKEIVTEMAEETTWPVDKQNSVERESKEKKADNSQILREACF